MAGESSVRDKRIGETDLQWRSRLARRDAMERDRSAPLVTPEAERHGDYVDADVMHIETRTVAVTKRNRIITPIEDMWGRGGLTDEQYSAAIEIGTVVETIERAVSVRGASLEARVDNSRGASDLLIERFVAVLCEVMYSRWRTHLPMPRRMLIDMIVDHRPLVATARRYGVNWRRARDMMINQLNRWNKVRDGVFNEIGGREVYAAQMRAGGGILLGVPYDERLAGEWED